MYMLCELLHPDGTAARLGESWHQMLFPSGLGVTSRPAGFRVPADQLPFWLNFGGSITRERETGGVG